MVDIQVKEAQKDLTEMVIMSAKWYTREKTKGV